MKFKVCTLKNESTQNRRWVAVKPVHPSGPMFYGYTNIFVTINDYMNDQTENMIKSKLDIPNYEYIEYDELDKEEFISYLSSGDFKLEFNEG